MDRAFSRVLVPSRFHVESHGCIFPFWGFGFIMPGMHALDNTPIIFSDLDGTLLDHDTYGFVPALPALSMIKEKQIPLVLTSSKTLTEIIGLRRDLENAHPFIAENGSVVGIPPDYFPGFGPTENGFKMASGIWVKCMGGNREEVLATLNQLRDDHGFPFEGFADMSPARLAGVTGLSEKGASLARERLSTEPILWQGTGEQWKGFTRELSKTGLGWVQGGRFISISRPFDKKDGVELLLDLYQTHCQVIPLTIGLGDSPNDKAMLDMMDTAVVIRSGQSDRIIPDGPGTVIRTTRKGPEGWQEAMDEIFKKGGIYGG